MSEVLEQNTLERWQAQPLDFITEVLRDNDGRPFKLFDAQKEFFKHAWQRRDDGRLRYPEQCIGWIKKTGKTDTAGMHMLTTTLIFGGRYAESFCIASDLEQAQGRVFAAVRRMCECSPLLKREAEITQSRISFPQTGAVIQAIGSDYASAAGAHPCISSFDELWTYTSERSRRLWDEMIPVPTRTISCRLTTTHAGYENESTLLLELYKRGLALPEVAPNLHAGDHLLFTWVHEPLAPWQNESWLAEMRQLTRPIQYLRQYENRFVTSESTFIDMSNWDRCVQPNLGAVPHNALLPVWIGVDASVKHDSSAIVCVTYDTKAKLVRLVFHRIFQPTPEDPINFEQTIEATLIDLHKRFQVRKILADPYQMVASMQRLAREGLPIEEFAQSSPNLTAASQQLYELISGQALACYPDAAMRLAMTRTVAKETSRGWHISKEKQSHKIDVIVALSMACHAAVQGQSEPYFDRSWRWVDSDIDAPQPPNETPAQREARKNAEWRNAQYMRHLLSGGDGSARDIYSSFGRSFRWT
jgi:phage terminase large subunit-like protein